MQSQQENQHKENRTTTTQKTTTQQIDDNKTCEAQRTKKTNITTRHPRQNNKAPLLILMRYHTVRRVLASRRCSACLAVVFLRDMLAKTLDYGRVGGSHLWCEVGCEVCVTRMHEAWCKSSWCEASNAKVCLSAMFYFRQTGQHMLNLAWPFLQIVGGEEKVYSCVGRWPWKTSNKRWSKTFSPSNRA